MSNENMAVETGPQPHKDVIQNKDRTLEETTGKEAAASEAQVVSKERESAAEKGQKENGKEKAAERNGQRERTAKTAEIKKKGKTAKASGPAKNVSMAESKSRSEHSSPLSKLKFPRKTKKAKGEGDLKEQAKFMPLSIRNKVILCFMIPILFMVIVGVAAYQKAASGMSNKFKESTIQTLSKATEYIDLGCTFIEAESTKYATDPSLVQLMQGLYKSDPINELNVSNNFKTTIVGSQGTNAFVTDIHIIPRSGSNILTTKTNATMDGILQEYLDSLGMTRNDVDEWIDQHPAMDEKLGTSQSDYILSNEVMSEKGGFLVVIDISSKTIRDFLGGLDLGDGSIVGFVTEGGRELICENLPEGKKSELTEGEKVFYGQDFYTKVMEGEQTNGAVDVTYNGKRYFFIYSESSKNRSAVCALVPKGIVTGQADDIRTITVWLVVLACLIAASVGMVIVKSIQNNMNHISHKFEEVAKGDLTVRVNAKGHDEFRYLAASATNMVTNTKQLVNKVTGASGELEDSADEVKHASSVIDRYSKKITMAIEDINEGMTRQAQDAQECVFKTDVLSNEIKVVSNVIETVEKLVGETEDMINHGMEIVQLLGERAQETTEITTKVGESIENLRKESETISGFVVTITDITEQTNLLSLNASIEAARAGESGKGFAVVAEQIRKLADDSAAAAGEIGHNVEHISAQTLNSVASAEQAKDMVALQTQAVGEVIDVFREMQDRMKQLVDGLKQMIIAIGRADRERSEAVSAVKNISAVIDETAESSETVKDVAKGLMENVGNLSKTAKALSENMNGLKAEISVFKI